jgi:hypothetical protein
MLYTGKIRKVERKGTMETRVWQQQIEIAGPVKKAAIWILTGSS